MRQHAITNGYNNPAYGSWTGAIYPDFKCDHEPVRWQGLDAGFLPAYTPTYKLGTASVIGQSDITVSVQEAQLTDNDDATPAPQSITVSAKDGAAISADTGETVLIGAGALTADTAVSISRINLADLQAQTGMAAPEPTVFQTIGAFHLDLGADIASVPIQLAITLQDNAGVQAGDEILILRRGKAPDVNGVMQDTWWILDNGYVGTDAGGQLIARTASIPYVGVSASGDYAVVRSVVTNAITGAVKVTGMGSKLSGLMIGRLALAIRPSMGGGLGGMMASIGAMLVASSIDQAMYAINQTMDGAYVTKPIDQIEDNFGNITLDFKSTSTDGNNTILNKTSPKVLAMQVNVADKIFGGKLEIAVDQALVRDALGNILPDQPPTRLRIFISPEQLLIDSKGNAHTSSQSDTRWDSKKDGSKTAQHGMLVWGIWEDIEVTGDTFTVTLDLEKKLDALNNPASLDIKYLALGLHTITIQRIVERPIDLAVSDQTEWLANGYQTGIAMQGRNDISVVTTNREISIREQVGEVFKEIKNLNYEAIAAELNAATVKIGDKEILLRQGDDQLPRLIAGFKTDQLAFSEDNRLLFVASTKGRIAIVDTATLRLVDYIQVAGSTDNIASLAVAGDYLYVAEGGRFTTKDESAYNCATPLHRLLRVNIDAASKDFLKAQQIDLPAKVSNLNAPYGYFDLAILKGNHNYLAVTASKSNIPIVPMSQNHPHGRVFVLDLNALTEPPKNSTNMVGVPETAIRIVKFSDETTGKIGPAGNGKGPQYITPATVKTDASGNPEKVRFLLSNAFDYNKGVDAIEIDLNKTGENMGGFAQGKEATVTSLVLSPNTGLMGSLINTLLTNKYRLNVQRAQGAVYYYDQANDTEYALVADYFIAQNDSGFDNGDLEGKQAGGKVAIIKDPFKVKGAPEYLGSTTPILNASIKDLSLSPDSNTLLGNINYWAQTGDPNPPSSGVLKWDLAALIKAANDHSIKVQAQSLSRTIPFDRTGSYATNTQIPEATPEKIDFGWVFGMANNITAPVVQAGNANYGDIARVDIVQAIRKSLANPELKISGFNQANIWIEPQSERYAELVTYIDQNGETRLVSGAQDKNLLAVSAAKDASYDGKFNKEGVFFLSPQFTAEEMQALRAGERLPDRIIKIRVTGLTVDDGGNKKYNQSFVIEVDLKDFTDAAGRVFFGDRPLDDPGYSAFKLNGEVSSTNVVDTAAEALDVWRVEQRLRYLAFPAMYTGSQPTVANNTIQDFKVDGQFNAEERAALKLFEKVVRYGPDDARQFNTSTPGADGMIEAGGGEKDITMSWLSAYNAPHWMQFFESTPGGDYPYATSNPSLPGWENMQKGQFPSTTEPTNIELYGTSWVYDLMAAVQFAPAALRGNPVYDAQGNITGYTPRNTFWFNGATDANYGFTPLWNPQDVIGQHQTHDLGMAFDLGVTGYISNLAGGAQAQPEQPLTSVITAVNDVIVPWSLDAALNYSAQLPNEIDANGLINYQLSAMRDFMSLYAVTQSNTWGEMSAHVVNGTAARDALFGAGTQTGGMITQVVIGGTGSKNPYPNMRKVLSGLGISNNYNAPDHQSHFHVFLNVPTLKAITGTGYLLTDNPADSVSSAAPQTDARALLDYTNNLIEGEELMFIMDVPYIPAQDTPIVLAQAAAPGATPQPDYILQTCGETESTGDPRSALRAVDPASMLSSYLYWNDKTRVQSGVPIDLTTIKNITLLQGTTHGELLSSTSNYGRTTYHYDAIPNYIGNDRAVFQAEFEGKVYKIVLELHVFRGGVPGDFGASTCPEPTLIKVNGKPVSGALGSDVNVSVVESLAIDASAITVTFADLPGGAVGQTTGSTITLDTNAANYNWFIDPTPWDNSEYLPTSNPDEWVAKAGTAAYGKMDMLSVLLHEYGHALGIDHSADNHDYMATTLTPGVRRMPSADELALMGQLVAQAKDGLVGRVTPADSTPDNAPAPFPTLPFGTTLSLAFLGRLRSSRYGGMNIEGVLPYAPTTQYAVAANATFVGLSDVGRVPPADSTQQTAGGTRPTLDGWNTQGSVDVANGIATLNEISTSQTRLSQVFMLSGQRSGQRVQLRITF